MRLCVGIRLLVGLSIAGLLAVARCGLCGLAILRLSVLRLSVCAGGLAVLRLLLAVASGGGLSVCGGLWGAIALRLAASWPYDGCAGCAGCAGCGTLSEPYGCC